MICPRDAKLHDFWIHFSFPVYFHHGTLLTWLCRFKLQSQIFRLNKFKDRTEENNIR